MSKKKKGRQGIRPRQKINKLVRWADRATGWWKEATEGWDRLCDGLSKASISLLVICTLLAPGHTANMIKVLTPAFQVLMQG